jgi:hypothetical protein
MESAPTVPAILVVRVGVSACIVSCGVRGAKRPRGRERRPDVTALRGDRTAVNPSRGYRDWSIKKALNIDNFIKNDNIIQQKCGVNPVVRLLWYAPVR